MKLSQYHRVLNVPEGSSTETIKQVTKELLKKYHPDLNQRHRQWAETQTKRILEAYQVLVRTPNSAPSLITKRGGEQRSVHIQIAEKKYQYMETHCIQDNQTSSISIDVDIIECVVPVSAIKWLSPQSIGHYREAPLFIINELLCCTALKMDETVKVLIFKKSDSPSPNLAYLFRDGGTFIEVRAREMLSFASQVWGEVNLPTCCGKAYISIPALKAMESLF